ncbi:HAD family acid phosphatase [Streptomyces sp. NPDC002004]
MAGRGVSRKLGAGAAVMMLGLGGTAAGTASAAAAPRAEARTAASISAPAANVPASAKGLAAPLGTPAAQAAGVDYGTWQRDVQAVIDQAKPYVAERTAHAAGQKLAIVFDVDNTTLETDFHPWYQYPTPAVGPSLDLARYAKSRGVDVFFVTARPGIIEGITKYNLKSVGYPVSGIYVRDLADLFDEVSAYKTAKRAEIEAQGYTIIANVGNHDSDLAGGHAERTFKLPDYDGKLS